MRVEAKKIVGFMGGYDRTGLICIDQHPEEKCDVCRRINIPVIMIDSSEGEYGSGNICKECAEKAFAGFIPQQ